ncbi:unnamed protein product [Ceratitis capitata]|uniref:(Mediterranean fruit fly) hypothetical protein n=1 Tax=Ceratitis capitata TaxID=7213 RepID=A0A811VBH4_CERCA|nr:unnamed protein product [Ceratitis capitata]
MTVEGEDYQNLCARMSTNLRIIPDLIDFRKNQPNIELKPEKQKGVITSQKPIKLLKSLFMNLIFKKKMMSSDYSIREVFSARSFSILFNKFLTKFFRHLFDWQN